MKVLHVISGLSRKSGGPARSSQGLVAALCKVGVDAWIWALDGSHPWIPGVRGIDGIVGFEQAARTPLPPSLCRIDEFDLVHIHGIWSRKLHKVAVMCRRAGVKYVIAPRGMLEPWSLKQKWLKKRIARWLYQDKDLKCAVALHATAESEAEQFRRLGSKNEIIVSPNGVNVPDEGVGSREWGVGIAEKDPDCLTRKERECIVSRIEQTENVLIRYPQDPEVLSFIKGYWDGDAKTDGNRTWTVEFSNKKELTGMPTTGEAATVEVTRLKSPSTHNILKTIYAVNGAPRRALFVSRMHPKKGVLELVEAFAKVKDKGEGERWCVELVYTMNSEEERAYEQKVKNRILALGMSYQDKDGTIHCSTSTSHFDFLLTGPLDDDAKWDAYARADLFVLPTYSENFGIVVAEALWAGVPVITTKGTPWGDLVSSRSGWWIDLPAEGSNPSDWTALQEALMDAFSKSNTFNSKNQTILQKMGQRGHELVARKYTWEAVVKPVVEGYLRLRVGS